MAVTVKTILKSRFSESYAILFVKYCYNSKLYSVYGVLFVKWIFYIDFIFPLDFEFFLMCFLKIIIFTFSNYKGISFIVTRNFIRYNCEKMLYRLIHFVL